MAPTTPAAERARRPAVQWRAGRVGTHSAGGARVVARRLTVTATGRRQERSVLDDLTAVCTVAHRRHPLPSLLPAAASHRYAVNGRNWQSRGAPAAPWRRPSRRRGGAQPA